MKDFNTEIEILKNAVIKAGKEVLNVYNNLDFETISKKDNSPVTIADLKSNEILIKELSKTEMPIISEENENNLDLNNKYYWVVDPLDGTKDFINKTNEFSIMVALIKDFKPIIACIYLPVTSEMYFAQKNKGSYLIKNNNEIKLKVSNKSDLSDLKMLISRNHFKEYEKKIAKSLKINDFRAMGSIGIKLGKIAQNKGDFYMNLEPYLGIWDACAPSLIITEAGGEIFDKNGDSLVFNSLDFKMEKGVIATNGKNKKEIIELIKKYN